MLGLVAPQDVSQCLHDIRAAQQSDLDDLWLKVVYDSLHLLSDDGGGQIVELLDAQRVLYRDRGNGRNGLSAKFVDKPDIGLHPRDARAVTTGDCQYRCTHFCVSYENQVQRK
jgi:hypothetical protein